MKKILVLVPHDLVLDPRVSWMCRSLTSYGDVSAIGIKQIYDREPVAIDTVTYIQSPYDPTKLKKLFQLLHLDWKLQLYFVIVFPLISLIALPFVVIKKVFSVKKYPRVISDIVLLAYVLRSFLKVFVSLLSDISKVHISPDFIFANDLESLLTAIWLKKKSFDVKIVYDAHEYYPYQFPCTGIILTGPLKFLEGLSLKHVDEFITVTPQLASIMKVEYSFPKEVHAIPNATPLEEIQLGDPQEKKIIEFLYQGNFIEARGLEQLLKYWAKMNLSEFAILILRGPDSEYKNYCMSLAQRLDPAGMSIKFLPSIPEKDLVLCASTADVGIIPYEASSINNLNCCPNKMSQYMQAGISVIANDLPFVRGVINESGCGLIFDINSYESFYFVVRELLDSPENLRKMKLNARQFAMSTYNWDKLSRPVLTKILGPVQ